jgi:hypothetical protein
MVVLKGGRCLRATVHSKTGFLEKKTSLNEKNIITKSINKTKTKKV